MWCGVCFLTLFPLYFLVDALATGALFLSTKNMAPPDGVRMVSVTPMSALDPFVPDVGSVYSSLFVGTVGVSVSGLPPPLSPTTSPLPHARAWRVDDAMLHESRWTNINLDWQVAKTLRIWTGCFKIGRGENFRNLGGMFQPLVRCFGVGLLIVLLTYRM